MTNRRTPLQEFAAKEIEVLKEAVPRARRIASLLSRGVPGTGAFQAAIKQAVRSLGVTLLTFAVSRPEEIDAARDRIAASRVDALYVVTDPVIEVGVGKRGRPRQDALWRGVPPQGHRALHDDLALGRQRLTNPLSLLLRADEVMQ